MDTSAPCCLEGQAALLGYRPIPNHGKYAGNAAAVCLAKRTGE